LTEESPLREVGPIEFPADVTAQREGRGSEKNPPAQRETKYAQHQSLPGLTKESLREAAEAVARILSVVGNEVRVDVAEDAREHGGGRVKLVVHPADSDRVLREISQEELMAMLKRLHDEIGLMLDKEV
jgi:uncharacterized FlaG/YvyC family protein